MINKKNIYKSNIITITINKRARYEYFIIKEFQAGLVLQGWEVKALRAGKANISGSYVLMQENEAYIWGITIVPLNITSSHVKIEQMRNRKLLLTQHELNDLFSKIRYEGYTAVPLSLYWKNSWCKVKIGIAKGKKEHDKRLKIKKREWALDKIKLIKHVNRCNQ